MSENNLFEVVIRQDLVDHVDELCEKINMTRQEFVVEAVRKFLVDATSV